MHALDAVVISRTSGLAISDLLQYVTSNYRHNLLLAQQYIFLVEDQLASVAQSDLDQMRAGIVQAWVTLGNLDEAIAAWKPIVNISEKIHPLTELIQLAYALKREGEMHAMHGHYSALCSGPVQESLWSNGLYCALLDSSSLGIADLGEIPDIAHGIENGDFDDEIDELAELAVSHDHYTKFRTLVTRQVNELLMFAQGGTTVGQDPYLSRTTLSTLIAAVTILMGDMS